MAKEKAAEEQLQLELRMSEDTVRPSFANLVQSNVTQMQDGPRLTTLTFIHVFPVPTSATESTPQGEVVSRVVMSEETVEKLRDVFNSQKQRVLKAGRPKTARRKAK